MSSSAVQLSFSLRTTSGVKNVHLIGSWDNYVGQLPLSRDRSSSKSGAWKGTFKFQNNLLQAGQRYWYYYIIDGYHVSHDPGQASTLEPTTNRTLNILDVPFSKSSSSSKESSSRSSKHKSSSSSSKHSSSSSKRHSTRDRLSVDVPKGRPLSVSQIQSPKPINPQATKYILESDYTGVVNNSYYAPSSQTVDELTSRFSTTTIGSSYYDGYASSSMSSSPPSSVGSSLSSRSDSSSPSSASSLSDGYGSSGSNCTCERYGITRGGDRVKLDCGGSRCGYSDYSDSCESGSDDDVARMTRRQGVYVRA